MDSQLSDDMPNPDTSPEQIEEAFSEAERLAEELQAKHLAAAQHVGYTKDVLSTVKGVYINLAQMSSASREYDAFLASGIAVAKSITSALQYDQTSQFEPGQRLNGVSASAGSLADATSNVLGVLGTTNAPAFELGPPPFFSPDESRVAEKLAVVDPALAKTYQGIGQVYHATNADPGRAAIALMRQAFDHFFDQLAPDDKVLSSPYWTKKRGDKPNQVSRRERMIFAAHVHIRDAKRAEAMVLETDLVLKSYEILNKLHKRGTLSDKQIRRALGSMKRFFERWAECL